MHFVTFFSIIDMLFSFSLRPLFPGSNELDQISRIHDIVGTPSSAVLQKLKKQYVYTASVLNPRLSFPFPGSIPQFC